MLYFIFLLDCIFDVNNDIFIYLFVFVVGLIEVFFIVVVIDVIDGEVE